MGNAAEAAGRRPDLDELMMAMDVVDTLRHEERMATQALAQDSRDETLKRRLREIYEGQGLEVTDAILEEGIRALRESRFVYTPPAPGWRVTAAKLWIARDRVLAGLGVVLLLLVLWGGWSAWQGGAEERLAARLSEAAEEATGIAGTEAARDAVVAARAEGEAALAAGDTERASAVAARLADMARELSLAYEVRVVSRPGERSGVYRIPDVNEAARNHYLVVEAIAPGGEALERTVLNEETGRREKVTVWAQRVPEATYDAVARDKQDDGIVQDAVLGRKAVGALAPDWRVPVLEGAITEW